MTLDESKKTGFTYKGQEIVLSKTRGRPFNEGKGLFPIAENKRIEVVTLFAATGNPKLVAELSGVSESAVRKWRKEQWFIDLLNEVRAENDDKIDSKFTEIIDRTLDLMLDRVKNGDIKVKDDGTEVRQPLRYAQLAIPTAIAIDKRQLMRGKPTSRVEQVSSGDQLKQLAETFKQLAQKGRPKVEVIEDVEFTEIPNEPLP